MKRGEAKKNSGRREEAGCSQTIQLRPLERFFSLPLAFFCVSKFFGCPGPFCSTAFPYLRRILSKMLFFCPHPALSYAANCNWVLLACFTSLIRSAFSALRLIAPKNRSQFRGILFAIFGTAVLLGALLSRFRGSLTYAVFGNGAPILSGRLHTTAGARPIQVSFLGLLLRGR